MNGGASTTYLEITSNGNYLLYINPVDDFILFRGRSGGFCEIDNVSVKEVNLGPELITNGDFSTNGTPNSSSFSLGWTTADTGLDIASGVLELNNGGSITRVTASNGLDASFFFELNRTYRITYDIVSNTGGVLKFYYNSVNKS